MYTPTNTRILVPEFDYVRPSSLGEALSELADPGRRNRPMLGGTDLLVQMKMERKAPTCLVDLNGIPELHGIAENATGLRIGAATTIRELSNAQAVNDRYTALAEACRAFSTVPIMVMATLGGNLCNASPAADTVPALLAFDAKVEIASATGSRMVPLREFLVGPGETVLREGEIVVAVQLASPAPGSGSAFIKIARVAADISKACVAVKLTRKGDSVVDCRIALGAVAPTAIRLDRAEGSLVGHRFDMAAAHAAADIVAQDIRPITDVRATKEYRRTASRVVSRDALKAAWERVGRGGVA